MSTKTKPNKKKPALPNAKHSQQRMARPPRGAQKDPYKEAWMAGARSGTEVAYELMMTALENMGRTLGIKRRKRPSVRTEPR